MKVLDEGGFSSWNSAVHSFEQEVSTAWSSIRREFDYLVTERPELKGLTADVNKAVATLENLLVKIQKTRNK